MNIPLCNCQKAGKSSARSTASGEECEYCTSSTTRRRTGRESCKKSASVIGGTGRRSATSAQPGNPGEPGNWVTVLIGTRLLKMQEHPAGSLRHQEKSASTTGRGTDRERSKGGRQCREDTDLRKERRESRNCQGIQLSLDYGRSPER